jgi:hypothetical protein
VIENFNNPEDLMRCISEAREAADSQVLDFQKKLSHGDLCLSYNADCEAFLFHELTDPLAGAEDDEEREYLRESYARPELQHYRFSRSYSVHCPEGELGDVHVSTVSLVIPRTVWDQCRELGWHGHARIVELLREHSRRISALTFGRVQDGQN